MTTFDEEQPRHHVASREMLGRKALGKLLLLNAMDELQPPSAAPYSTGGGGVVLEHRVAAVLLSSLLLAESMPLLGDEAVAKSIRFQASAFSPIDDLLVVGQTPDGGARKLSIGVRRSPKLTKSDESSLGLLTPYVEVALDHWGDLSDGTWRLGLVVADSTVAVRQLNDLVSIARGSLDSISFHAEVRRPRRTNKGVRGRHTHVVALVDGILNDLDRANTPDAEEVTWRLLKAMGVMSCRVEGADQSDRTSAVRRLQGVTRDQSPAAADALFAKLAELAGTYAPQAANVDVLNLRRDLKGVALKGSPRHARAWQTLQGLADRLNARTGFQLVNDDAELELERSEARESLKEAMNASASSGSGLLVTGEPDVGKSALTMRVAEMIAAEGSAVTALSLRDLPSTTLDLENLLGGRLDEVLSEAASGPNRLLVIDGAEAALEGRGGLLADLAEAAGSTGYGVVAVTRRDGRGAVAEALSARQASSFREHEIPGLTDMERAELKATFAMLSGLDQDTRSTWLLSRPGLVDLLLRVGPGANLSPDLVSEVHVFAIIWSQLVRRGEKTSNGGTTPDAREQALIELARRQLLPSTTRSTLGLDALASLRSDGLLLSAGLTSAWNPDDGFASDLVRDFAIAKLLIVEGWDLIRDAEGPRWGLRAVRLACQAALMNAGEESEPTRLRLQQAFDSLGEQFGKRWAELPLEALLTLGDGGAALKRAWPGISGGDAKELDTALRIASQRYTTHGFGEPYVLAPLVEFAYCGSGDHGQTQRHSDSGKRIREVVLDWLRGLIRARGRMDPLRQRVRGRILDSEPPFYDEFAVEALGTLGPDLDDRATDFLRGIAGNSPGSLRPLAESVGASLAMTANHPDLLLELAETYYIEVPEKGEFGFHPMDDGIRQHSFGGIGSPMASWYYGPFFRLLNVRPIKTIAMINRMLDHAARIRIGELNSLGGSFTDSESKDGIEIDLPVVGRRHCTGDAHVWSWYRGSTVGPYPCMSALLALERFCDSLIATAKVPLEKVAEMLLRDCNSLAMPGLVVGLLVRHLETAGDLLDPFLENPVVWRLEFGRTVSEGQMHIQGADDPDLIGRDRRRWTFREAAAQMVILARLKGDDGRLAELGAIADRLTSNAESAGYAGEDLAAAKGWAASLRSERYTAERHESGGIAFGFEPPEEVESALRDSQKSISRTNTVLGLRLKYTKVQDRTPPDSDLLGDLRVARGFAEDPDGLDDLFGSDAIDAVAASAIVGHARGTAVVPDEDLDWAAEILMNAAVDPKVDQMSFESTVHPYGADRSAGAALPLLLLPCFDRLRINRTDLRRALTACSQSLFDEVRSAAVHGFRGLWWVDCSTPPGSDVCFHQAAWEVVESGLRDCQMGDWEGERRGVAPLEPPYAEALASVATNSLLANRLVHPLVAASDATRSGCCAANRARALLGALHAADRRAARHWAEENYGHFSDHQRALVARVLIEQAVTGDGRELHTYVREFLLTPAALNQLLRDLAVTFTYDEALRPELAKVWRELAIAALEEIESGAELPGGGERTTEEALAGLIPTPQIEMADSDPDRTIAKAEEGWVTPSEIEDLFERWLPLVEGEAPSVDAATRFAMTADSGWQMTVGLALVERTIAGKFGNVANSCWFLAEWLGRLQAEQSLQGNAANTWRRIVDGLAAAGDTRAAKLQQSDE
jgi:hypothetical protein